MGDIGSKFLMKRLIERRSQGMVPLVLLKVVDVRPENIIGCFRTITLT